MDLVLAGLTWDICLVFIDDVIVFAPAYAEHLERLELVMQRLRWANLKLKPSKCHLFQRKVSFLGYIVSGEGLEPDPDKVSAVIDWPVPQNLTEVRAFTGLCSYSRKFIKGFSTIASPLYELTRKGERFHRTAARQFAFERLKEPLTSAPILDMPCSEDLLILDTDASNEGLGAVLSQVQEGETLVANFTVS
jgi:hypothetical protein